MSILLKTTYTNPQEREFEAWIVQGIEEYFRSVGIGHAIWAVSPADEVDWPADEALSLDCKVVGLQFKQAKLAKGPLKFNRLKWTLHQPPAQFGRVQANSEIFYCLPTFINREFRRVALEHCLFWRPDAVDDRNVWYDNPRASTPYKRVCDAMRWGRFVERIMSCEVGKRVRGIEEAKRYVKSFKQSWGDEKPDLQEPPGLQEKHGPQQDDITYFVAIKYVE